MSDSTAIEAIAQGFYEADDAYRDTWESQPGEGVKDEFRKMARAALAVLREAGLEIVNREQTIEAELVSLSVGLNQPQHLGFNVVSLHQLSTSMSLSPGDKSRRFRLVPVGGED